MRTENKMKEHHTQDKDILAQKLQAEKSENQQLTKRLNEIGRFMQQYDEEKVHSNALSLS